MERDYWVNVSRVALKSLPLLDKGGRFRLSDIRERLMEINEAGHSLRKGWRKLCREETLAYFSKVRGEIRAQARIYCKDVLDEIDRENYIQREEGRNIR